MLSSALREPREVGSSRVRVTVCRVLQGLALLSLIAVVTPVQGQSNPRTTKANYAQADKFSSSHLAPLTYSTAVLAKWIGKTDTFWYSYRTSKGTIWWKVDAEKKTKTKLFNHEKVASQLSELTKKPVEVEALPLLRGQMNPEGTK